MRGIFSNTKVNVAFVFIGLAIAAYYYHLNAKSKAEAERTNSPPTDHTPLFGELRMCVEMQLEEQEAAEPLSPTKRQSIAEWDVGTRAAAASPDASQGLSSMPDTAAGMARLESDLSALTLDELTQERGSKAPPPSRALSTASSHSGASSHHAASFPSLTVSEIAAAENEKPATLATTAVQAAPANRWSWLFFWRTSAPAATTVPATIGNQPTG